MSIRLFGFLKALLVVSAVACFCLPAVGQDRTPSREQIFGGYSYLTPNASIGGVAFDEASRGYLFSSSTFFNRYVGLQVETGAHFAQNVNISTIQGGLVVRFLHETVSPFVHSDVGFSRFSPAGFSSRFGPGITGGGGVDIRIYKALEWRIFQTDFIYSHENFTPIGPRLNPISARVATGLVWNFGSVK